MELETIMGVEILKWEEYDILEGDTLQFYNVEFLLPELESYNTGNVIVALSRQGELAIYDDEKFVKELNIASLRSFREKLNEYWETKTEK
ncbi:hypothetical protein NSQ93_22445 [Bacillus sp. FSL W8-0445]|uniref:hypothetical protein n=1 Tax=Bacillota TaxID=1239 RepID=UPI000778FD02|nr:MULTISPECIES: hypothetical protein [Bacillota]KYC77061.1 hypothetical protein B4092_4798 [Bacillus licheniformis]MDE1407030.1 hypothetical protein [Bacillus licheniformis]NFT30596.1 hypothetical protein [Clostridium sporogenes]TWN76591.1 hypothetical protein CHCC20494_0654 [Bacillus licheniformis]GIN25518.1 hypothetical protein J31TS2_20980 [Bacillus licheniformis]